MCYRRVPRQHGRASVQIDFEKTRGVPIVLEGPRRFKDYKNQRGIKGDWKHLLRYQCTC